VTVAEPLNLQGWQLVDELNRAMQKAEPSGYVTPLHVVTKANIEFDGGDKNLFDPGNGYRDEYKKIWGK
jgi:ribose transport system substrate-binding protein